MVITAAGTVTAYGLARSLRDRWGSDVTLVGADTGPPELVPAEPLLDDCRRVPASDDPDFPAALDAVLRDHAPVLYVPLIDSEIAAAAARAEAGTLPDGVTLPWPGARAARLCADKLALAEELLAAGLPAAPAARAAEADWSPEGVVVKPRDGFGGRGVRAFTDRHELERARDTFTDDELAQPLLAPPEITVDAVALRDGRVRAVARERLAVRGGVATKARVFEDAELAALAARLAEVLGLRGAFCFQVMHDGDGRRLITDLNARPGGGTRMTVAAGVDVLCAPFADLWELPVSDLMSPLQDDRIVVRHFEETVR